MKITMILLIFNLYACTNKQLYDTIQTHNRIQCQKLPVHQQDNCLVNNDVTYEEYQIEKDKI